ncbi:FAD dependent oxidoreductase [Necator americanus]|uniref:FAD dependent oxidoreductase n=1 Tax=Necator americanus TaxID=51031 RepID=W2TAK7_NECAM|nr:FAD dependent oxidoreductase [Necator americanus]ETN78873.1 FAD dependent oxidoreductase [Necator americanus]
MGRVAVIGEGVIGTSTALALKRIRPNIEITIFHDRPFEKTCSAMPAGLFRFDNINDRADAKVTFDWYADLCRRLPGTVTGVKLLSGHIQSDSKEALEGQEKAYGDIVYNFRYMSDKERESLFVEPSKYAIHFSSYAAEGNQYVPFLKKQLVDQGVVFKQRAINNVEELADDGYDIVINCAGLNAGKLAGDDTTVYPIRGVVFEVDAPWHKHFNYRDFCTFTIPKNNSVVVGSVKQVNRSDVRVTEEDRNDIWRRYEELHPAMKDARILGEWCHLRPARESIRVESVAKRTQSGATYTVVHNYGHGGHGFTVGWGTAVRAATLVDIALGRSRL